MERARLRHALTAKSRGNPSRGRNVAERIALATIFAKTLETLAERLVRREWDSLNRFFSLFPILAVSCQISLILLVTENAVFRLSSSVYACFPILPARWHSKWNSARW